MEGGQKIFVSEGAVGWGNKKYTPPLTYLMDNPLININILSDQGLILENYVCKQ